MDNILFNYVYRFRIVLLAFFIYIFALWIEGPPTRILVHSGIFLFTLYLLAVYASIFLYLKAYHLSLVLLNMIFPVVFILILRSRYDGSVNHDVDFLFYIGVFIFILQVFLWISSFFIQVATDMPIFIDEKEIQDKPRDEVDERVVLGKAILLSSSGKQLEVYEIRSLDECIFVPELLACTGQLDFTEQFKKFLEDKKCTTLSYEVFCSYFKYDDMQQMNEVFKVQLQK